MRLHVEADARGAWYVLETRRESVTLLTGDGSRATYYPKRDRVAAGPFRSRGDAESARDRMVGLPSAAAGAAVGLLLGALLGVAADSPARVELRQDLRDARAAVERCLQEQHHGSALMDAAVRVIDQAAPGCAALVDLHPALRTLR